MTNYEEEILVTWEGMRRKGYARTEDMALRFIQVISESSAPGDPALFFKLPGEVQDAVRTMIEDFLPSGELWLSVPGGSRVVDFSPRMRTSIATLKSVGVVFSNPSK